MHSLVSEPNHAKKTRETSASFLSSSSTLPPVGLLCPFPNMLHPLGSPFLHSPLLAPDPTCPSKCWIDLILPQGLVPSLPSPDSYGTCLLWERCFHLSLSLPQCEFMCGRVSVSLVFIYTPPTPGISSMGSRGYVHFLYCAPSTTTLLDMQ